ncbi:MAG: hypothetical protein IKZ87_08335 [Actinomycetaceae bacterium]|nr:hypothetical protein [Actinomycetaceae bacterium]
MSVNRLVPFGVADELDSAQKVRTEAAPMPSAKTLKHRTNKLVQLGRFIAFNIRFTIAFIEEEINANKRV